MILRVFTIACLATALLLATVGTLRAIHVHVQVQTGCEQVQGQRLCGDSLAQYREFERTVAAAFKDDK